MFFLHKKISDKLALNDGLNIIIVGCGTVGRTLVEQLTKENHDITVIDFNSDKINMITNQYDVMGIVGNGASFNVQKEAGIKEADLLIAVTECDELNLLCCTLASRVADCSTIARVRNPEYSHELSYLRDKLGLAMIINPEYEAAKEINRILCLPTALEVTSFAHGKAELVKIRIPQGNALDKMSIAELGQTTNDVLVCAVERNKQIFIPSGNFELQSGDIMTFVSPSKAVGVFLKSIGFKSHKVKNAMIIGGGDAGYYLSKLLISNGIDVKIIEKNKSRCEELAADLPKAVVINGDGSDEDLLLEEGLETTQAFVPLTGSDEENILLALNTQQHS
ncbi:MAG TPA: Trk system potassium transporter TrkA, partial [Ruminococcaceae bacterium]|nr:Trk system potassium transporter TrkA [Oscillospiraceae bacterium]